MNSSVEMIELIARSLGDLRNEVLFLGGAVPSENSGIGQPPLAAGVVGGGPLDLDAELLADSLNRLFHLGPILEHRLAITRADVIQVNIARETRQIRSKQVERGASLERQPMLQERVAAKSIQQSQKTDDFLQWFGMKTGFTCRAVDFQLGQHQSTSSQDLERTCSGTMRFQLGISLPD